MNFCSQCKHGHFWRPLGPGYPPFRPICFSPTFEDKRDIVSGARPECEDVKVTDCPHFAKEQKEQHKKKRTLFQRLFG